MKKAKSMIIFLVFLILVGCKVENMLTVSFDSQGGSAVESVKVAENQTINLEVPVREGYAFDGWYSGFSVNDIKFGSITPVIKDLTLYAKWNVNQFTISFDTNGERTIDPITQDFNTTVTKPTDPTREGYTFGGWYADKAFTTQYTFTTMPSSDITLYAKWEGNQYEIIYAMLPDDFNKDIDIPLNVGETIIETAPGGYHFAALTSEGRLFTWGSNYYGQLGDGTTANRLRPVDITRNFDLNDGETILHISLGSNYSSVLTSEGRLFTWGRNDYGQVAEGTTTLRIVLPIDITDKFGLSSGERFIQISLGGSHSSALTSEGRLFTWGCNMSGQLGDGTVTTDKIFPTEITGNFDLNTGEKITQICIEMDHSSAITSEGRLYFWGLNNDGQLGDGTTKNKSLPTDITGNFELNTGEKIIDASLGYFHSAALTSQGRLFIWGGGHYGQLGDGAMYIRYLPYDITGKFDLHADETVKQISLGSYNSSALTSEGRLFTWGNNDYGQLGDGTTETRILPTNITDKFLLNSGETINKISLGFCDYSSAMTSESRLFIWGKNQYGPLGDGTTTNKLVPSEIVFCHPEVIKSQMYDLNEEILSYTPTKEGYTFSGWYCDLSFADRFDLIAMPAKKIILYCKFILNNN